MTWYYTDLFANRPNIGNEEALIKFRDNTIKSHKSGKKIAMIAWDAKFTFEVIPNLLITWAINNIGRKMMSWLSSRPISKLKKHLYQIINSKWNIWRNNGRVLSQKSHIADPNTMLPRPDIQTKFQYPNLPDIFIYS